ncbi:hypothetical protein [Streptomyces sp. CoH27]|uniref:hypothetical protein n=1 Tax=Streptomyces sp. CoH27 TaxID=2875763 RepID=UPI001CD63EFE|nr:hypothetical protein [Streptomyces sp. CoH27]
MSQPARKGLELLPDAAAPVEHVPVRLRIRANTPDLAVPTEPAPDHTLFVHVEQVEAARAPWPAAQVGQRVIGDLVTAPC